MYTRDKVEGLRNCREFSQPLSLSANQSTRTNFVYLVI